MPVAVQSPTTLRVGTYLTDGARLAEVRRVTEEGVIVEEGPVDTPDVTSLSFVDVAERWTVLRAKPLPIPPEWRTTRRRSAA